MGVSPIKRPCGLRSSDWGVVFWDVVYSSKRVLLVAFWNNRQLLALNQFINSTSSKLATFKELKVTKSFVSSNGVQKKTVS